MKSKISYINFDFPPIGGPGIWRAISFVKYLSEDGYRVTVFCSSKNRWNRTDESNLDKIPKEVKIYRDNCILLRDVQDFCRLKSKNAKYQITKKIWNGLTWRASYLFPISFYHWVFKVIFRSLFTKKKDKPDIIFTSGPPHDSHIAGLILSKIFKAKWVMDYRDLWFNDSLEDEPPQGRKIERWFEKVCLKKADRVVVVSPFWKDHLKNKYDLSLNKDKFKIIYNGHDLNLDKLPTKKETNNKYFHIHYNGTPQGSFDFGPQLLDVLKKVYVSYNSNPPIRITFSGWDSRFNEFVTREGLGEFIQNVGSMDHSESILFSSKADALMVIVDHSLKSMKGRIPGKTYEAMALGKHIFAILPRESDVIPILNEYKNATICYSDDQSDIYEKLYNIGNIIKRGGTSTNMHLLERFSRKNQAIQLMKLFDSFQE